MNSNDVIYPYIPVNIHIRNNKVVDLSTNYEFKINQVSREILALCNKNNSISMISKIIGNKYDVDETKVCNDIVEFVSKMNEKGLCNYYVEKKKIIFLGIFELFYLIKLSFRINKRYDICDKSKLKIFYLLMKISWSLLSKIVFIPLILLALTCFMAYIAEDNTMKMLLLNITTYYISFIFGVYLSIILHEYIHILLFMKGTKNLPCGHFLKHGLSVSYRHIKVKTTTFSRIAGGLFTGTLGIIGLVICLLLKNNTLYCYILMFFSIGFAIHIFNLLPFWGDGKEIFLNHIVRRLK